ncbi:MAG TPA: hypothetical protein VM143_14695 [Acidimicrobiales bacterium]|nr:hypothetical protein [Acidimicrobiales bacterium]
MSDPTKSQGGFGIVGIGAAACAACCAGPVLAILGGVTIAGVAGTMFVGVASLLVAVVAAVAYVGVRRRRSIARAVDNPPVAVTFTNRPVAGAAAPRATEGVR